MKNKNERKPLLALTASLLMPGLGQIYNGEISKGISLFLLFSFTLPVFCWLGIRGPEAMMSPVILSGVFLALTLSIFSVVDAFRNAKRIGSNYSLNVYNKGYIYLVMFFFGYFFVLDQLRDRTKSWVDAYNVPSQSMTPNILKGDHFFADKRVNYPGAEDQIQRGDAAIFVYPNNRATIYIKRIIGLPGDTVEIKGTEVLVNNKRLRGEELTDLGTAELNSLLTDHVAYVETGDSGKQYKVIWKKQAEHKDLSVKVPDGKVFVLGDNRDGAQDSRDFGFVPLSDITGKARQVWLSTDGPSGVRWSRFGQRL